MSLPIGFVNTTLPLQLKFQPETFVIHKNDEILGLISAIKAPGNYKKINITKLIFKENQYEIGKLLIEHILNKYSKQGAQSFAVIIDECHDELFNLFINGCGFRQCASETLWKIDRPQPQIPKIKWRYAQNSDSEKIANLYNSELQNIYKHSLSRHKKEFQTPFFGGFSDFYKIRYVLEEDNRILSYFSVTTSDNLNYICDIITNSGYDFDYNEIINVMLCDIARKKRAFYPIIKQKKYLNKSDVFETYLKNKNYKPIQTQQILVKDFYKPLKESSESWNVFFLGENQISQSQN